MTEITNLGGKIVNNWIFPLGDGHCLVDTGYRWRYAKFKKRLAVAGIPLESIKYVVITHMHSDHVGFLKELLGEIKPLLIYDASDRQRLEAGKNNLNTYVSRFEFMILSAMSLALFDKFQCFPAVFYDNCADAKAQPLKDLGITFYPLKGHSECDLCFTFEDKLFCGDLLMRGIASSKRAPMWVFNKYDMLESWKVLDSLRATTAYSGHGKPFPTSDIGPAIDFWRGRGVFRWFKKR